MSVHLHTLKGSAPAPLANYLKALGILRLVGEQADKQARSWWDGEYFCLLTKLSKAELEEFFLEKYEPTPLLSPWNKGCGFFKDNDPGLCPLEHSTAPRFERFRSGVLAARHLLDDIANADAVIRAIKARTKTTAKGFQSDRQRYLLENNETYKGMLQQLEARLGISGLEAGTRAGVLRDIATIRSLSQQAIKPPTKTEANALKESTGYKSLLAAAEKRFTSLKTMLLPDCCRLWRGSHAEWLSAAVVLNEDGTPDWPSLLGTGGNDGNLDFTNNFMQQLGAVVDALSENGFPKPIARGLLENALWAKPANSLTSAAVGQYQPGSAGGANSSTGFASGNLVNAWDFVLMMEGSIMFTSRATKRLDPNAISRASAPFAVYPHAVGFATPGSEKAQRGEQWMPLWRQPATLQDVAAIYGEARVQLKRQTANRPVDMARAVSRLGVARGIESFVRYGYLERNGQSTLAVPLGRVMVRHHPRAYLVDDLAGWLDKIQRLSRDKNAPSRLVHAERRLADAVFSALTIEQPQEHLPSRWQAILLAAADFESLQANGTATEAQPIPPLQLEWIAAVNDNSAEFRLALALGGAAADYFKGKPVDPVRYHWLPLEEKNPRRFRISDKKLFNDPRVVASGRNALRDLAAVVERRLIEAGMKGQRRSRLNAAPGCGARLDDLARFLAGSLDLDKLLGLARAFMALRWERWAPVHRPPSRPTPDVPEETWLAVRLSNLPWPLFHDQDIPADSRIVRLLLSGDATRAIEIARTRLQSAGIRPPLQAGATDQTSARLWAAALAFPITHSSALRVAAILDPSMKGPLHA